MLVMMIVHVMLVVMVMVFLMPMMVAGLWMVRRRNGHVGLSRILEARRLAVRVAVIMIVVVSVVVIVAMAARRAETGQLQEH